jgi:nucleoside-diphosphate-sugar epimerase
VVAATILAMEQAPTGELYNVGSGEPTTIVELTARMLEVAGSSLAPIYDAADWTAGSSRVGDTAKLRGLGWAPRVSLTDGLRNTWDWLRDRQ